jgi:hypothetical protein
MLVKSERLARYQAYVLRCWEAPTADAQAPATWRFTLENAHTEERQGFATLEALLTFLQIEFGVHEGRPATDSAST